MVRLRDTLTAAPRLWLKIALYRPLIDFSVQIMQLFFLHSVFFRRAFAGKHICRRLLEPLEPSVYLNLLDAELLTQFSYGFSPSRAAKATSALNDDE
jgi:hypothetical protein